jgi:hypothetical protein
MTPLNSVLFCDTDKMHHIVSKIVSMTQIALLHMSNYCMQTGYLHAYFASPSADADDVIPIASPFKSRLKQQQKAPKTIAESEVIPAP